MAKMHMRTEGEDLGYKEGLGDALCGWQGVAVTDVIGEVTCRSCVRALARSAAAAPKVAKRRARPRAEEPEEGLFVPSGPVPLHDVQGSTELEEASLAAIERSLRGHVERPYTWRSAQEALLALRVFRADGAGVTSTSNPERFKRLPMGVTDPTRKVAGLVERLHGVDTARARAYPAPRTFGWTRCSCGAARVCEGHEARVETFELSVEQQLAILDWSCETRVQRGTTPLSASSAAPLSVSSVALRAEKAWGIEITERQVSLVVKAGLAAVRAHLRAIGELAPPETPAGRDEDDMAVLGYDLSGWDAIEEHTKLSRKVLRRLSEREDDPLPVYEIPGVRGVHAKKAELDAWFEKNAQQRSRGAA